MESNRVSPNFQALKRTVPPTAARRMTEMTDLRAQPKILGFAFRERASHNSLGVTCMDLAKVNNSRATLLVKIYPFALIAISALIDVLVFGIQPFVIALPSPEIINALIIAAVLLMVNHSWLMTVTELTRGKFGLATTPEEWEAKGGRPQSIEQDARDALERRHNAHRNTTENAVYFVLLAAVIAIVSPAALMAQVWIVGFAVARLGYTYSYLSAQTGLRGMFMSLTLLSLYGMASYLVLAMFV